MYQTLERVFHPISKHPEIGLKSWAAPLFFNPLLDVLTSDESLFLMFDILPRVVFCRKYKSDPKLPSSFCQLRLPN